MRILIADDDRGTTAILRKTLKTWGHEVDVVHDGNAAWSLLSQACVPTLAIIDWMMPGLDGLQLCQQIRQHPMLAMSHVILLTARHSHADVVAGLDAGADDYMVKPFELDELRARVQVGVRVIGLQDRLAAQVSELQAARDVLTALANTDALTGVCSRGRWFDRASVEIGRCQRYQRPLSLLMIDLDLFKQVNDTFGHAVGDQVLICFADALRDQCRSTDIVGRIGGEEFAVLLPETSIDVAQAVALRIIGRCRTLSVPADAGSPVAFSCSIGVAEATSTDQAIEAALGRADAALYEAKRLGRNRVEVALERFAVAASLD